MVVILLEKSIPGFENEAGGHRVQRVPANEKRGRVHTSTVTCSVLEESRAYSIYDQREECHYSYRWFSGTGKGGQRRNKVQSCLELTHLPTGTSQSAHGRSRDTNAEEAMRLLNDKLDQLSAHDGATATNQVRSAQIGCGMRGDKRRTYRFQDDQVVDHVTGRKTSCKSFMRGDIERLW